MKNWFEYPDSDDERRKIADAVARVYKAANIPASGNMLAECFINSAYWPVYALLETPGDVAEFLQVVKNNCETLNFNGERGERLEATIRKHLKNGKCLVQLWGAAGTLNMTDRVYRLSAIMCTAAGDKRYIEFPLGDGIVACRADTDVHTGRAINLFWLPERQGEVSDEEALAALDGID